MPSSDRPRRPGTAWNQDWPPREELPRGIVLPNFSSYGTTWYERGLPYWWRRLGLTLTAAFILALYAGTLGLFLDVVYEDSPRAFYILLALEIPLSLLSGGWVLYQAIKHPAPLSEILGRRAPSRAAGSFGAGLGLLVRAGSALAGLFIVLLAAVSFGLVLVLFAGTFIPVPRPERMAREYVAEQLRTYGYDIPER
jgi:hypothetical protein